MVEAESQGGGQVTMPLAKRIIIQGLGGHALTFHWPVANCRAIEVVIFGLYLLERQ